MTLFHIVIGIICYAIVAVLFFFVKQRWLKLVIILLALVSAFVGVKISQTLLYPSYLGWEFENEIQKQPLFKAIKKYHPKEYQQYIYEVKKNLRKKEDVYSVSVSSVQLMDTLFFQHLQHAPDEPIFLYLKSTLDLYRHLYAINPQAVSKFENGDAGVQIDLKKLWEDKTFLVLLNHLLETKTLLIEESIAHPFTQNNTDNVDSMLDGILKELTQKYSEAVVRQTFSNASGVPPQLSANVIIEFYAQIISQGKENAAKIMRHLANLKTRSLGKSNKQG